MGIIRMQIGCFVFVQAEEDVENVMYWSQSVEKRDHVPHLSQINLYYYRIQLNHNDL